MNPWTLVEHVRIGRELKDGAGLRFTGQLGVVDFVRPIAKVAAMLDAKEDVCITGERVSFESSLDNHIRARAHRLPRSLRRIVRHP